MAQPASSVPLHINTQLDLNLGPRFLDVRPRGCGANGFVYSAVDTDCDKKVAIKRITFGDSVTCKYALREIKVMRRLQHENIISTWEVLGKDGKSLEDGSTTTDLTELFSVYIIQELLHTDLHHVIQSQQMKMEHVGFFTYQLLRGLKYLHSANVVHRDLKPSNILINCDDMMLKIGDFGLARVIDPNYGHDGVLTENMGTAWYRSPEQILHPKNYNKAVDVWSAGCIFAEMLTGRPIFRGVDDLDQLLQILDTVILMDDDWDDVLTIISNKVLQNHPLKIVVPLTERLAFVDREAVDLLVSLLTFSPKLRMTAEEALYHPYFRDCSNSRDEPIALHPLYIEHEDDNQPLSMMKQMIVEEVNSSQRCGSQMDWSRWEALHALQSSTDAPALDNNGNVSPTAPESPLLQSILDCHSEAKEDGSIQNISKVFFKKETYPCDDFTYAKCLSKETDIPEFELNEKYQEDEKERRELSPRKWEEEKMNERRRCLVAAASPSAIQPCDNHLQNSKFTDSCEVKNSEETDQDAYPSIVSIPSKSSPADEEDMEKYVEDINKKNNAINASNMSRLTYIEECNQLNDLNEQADDLDIFSLGGKYRKNKVSQNQAFKDQFNLRQQINSGLQSQGEDRVMMRGSRMKNCDATEEDCSTESMSSRSRHLTNERLRKNLQNMQLDSLCCEEGFLSASDQACAAIDTSSPRNSLDWILFSTDSHFPFPALPSYSISTSQWVGPVQDPNHGNIGLNDSATCGPCSPRSHPSGAKPKKYMKKKTKAT